MLGLFTVTVIEAHPMNPVRVDSNKVITRSDLRIGTTLSNFMTQLNSKPDVLQSCSFEKLVVPMLQLTIVSHKCPSRQSQTYIPEYGARDCRRAGPPCISHKKSTL